MFGSRLQQTHRGIPLSCKRLQRRSEIPKPEQTAYKQPATDSAGSPMPQNETNQECQSFVTQSAGTPTRDSCSGMSGTTELDLPFPLKDYLVPRTWHKPYAEALLEPDPSKMAALILVVGGRNPRSFCGNTNLSDANRGESRP